MPPADDAQLRVVLRPDAQERHGPRGRRPDAAQPPRLPLGHARGAPTLIFVIIPRPYLPPPQQLVPAALVLASNLLT